MKYNSSNEITSKLIQPTHGVTTRADGAFQTRESCVSYLVHRTSVDIDRIYGVHQIHGSTVHVLSSIDTSQSIYSLNADGLVVQKKHKPSCIFIKVADCIPLFLWDTETSNCAVVHSGWKGTYENITNRAIESMIKIGSRSVNIHAFIGPYIHECCYRVDTARARLFKSTYIRSVGGKSYLAIGTAVEDQLIRSGVLKENIDHSPLCTSCDARFFSYRRENAHTHGTMVAYIVV